MILNTAKSNRDDLINRYVRGEITADEIIAITGMDNIADYLGVEEYKTAPI